jgi:carbon storage regulator
VSGLVLTRRVGQRIRIGDDVEVSVARIDGDRVALRFIAPREITIVRGELIDAISAETEAATAARSGLMAALGKRPSEENDPAV